MFAFGEPQSLRVVQTGAAPTTGAGHARIRVLASSLTLSDSIVRRGLNPYTSALEPPFTIGYDFVGVVEDIHEFGGDTPTGLRVGDLVADIVRAGGNSDVVIRPVAELTRIAGPADAVQIEPLVMNGITAYQVLHRVAGVRPGQTILVHGGTGGVGLLLTELAVLTGARVIATGSPSKHPVLVQRGATALDGRSADLAEQVRAVAPQGVDAVFDGVGGPARAIAAATLHQGGVFVGFGFAGPAGLIDASGHLVARSPENLDHTAQVMAQGQAVLDQVRQAGIRAVEYEVGGARDTDRASYDADLNALVDLVASGRLRPQVEPVSFDGAIAAHARIDAGEVTGRLVLDHRPTRVPTTQEI